MLTMRFEYVRPIRTIVAVEKAVSTSFCAVPAFIRVDPAMTSGPVSTVTRMSTSSPTVTRGLHDTSAVVAPRRRASRSAPST